MTTNYEWCIEFSDKHGDIVENIHSDTLTWYDKEHFDMPEPDCIKADLVLIRDIWDKYEGLQERKYAYVKDGKLPEYFDECGWKVPKNFHEELKRFMKKGYFKEGKLYEFDDGGREKAGYKGFTGDCFCRAASIVTGLDYKLMYDKVIEYAKKERITKRKKKRSHPRTGVHMRTAKKIMEDLGYKWTPTMKIGQGCTVHLKKDELPHGMVMVRLSKHYSTIINGTIRDTYDPSRDGTRCVYGYWA